MASKSVAPVRIMVSSISLIMPYSASGGGIIISAFAVIPFSCGMGASMICRGILCHNVASSMGCLGAIFKTKYPSSSVVTSKVFSATLACTTAPGTSSVSKRLYMFSRLVNTVSLSPAAAIFLSSSTLPFM